MTPDEYKDAHAAINKKADEEKHELAKRYIRENAQFQIGDLITDGHRRIKVARVLPYSQAFNGPPLIEYQGMQYTSTLEPYKSGEMFYLFESNDTRKVTPKK
jgi:hypothetical protein